MRKSLLFSAVAVAAIAGNAKEAASVSSAVADNMVAKTSMAQRYNNVKSSTNLVELTKAQMTAYKMKAVAGAAGAYYERPRGVVYAGMSLATYTLIHSQMVATPYSKFDWTNLSTDLTSSSWKYSTGFDESGSDIFAISTDNVISSTYPEGIYTAPALNAVNAIGDSTYMAAEYFSSRASISNSTAGRFFNTNIKPSADIIAYNGRTVTNDDANTSSKIDEKFGFSSAGYSNVSLKGTAELFYATQFPYLLSEVAAQVCDTNKGKEALDVTMTIYEVTVDEDGQIDKMGDVICTATNDKSQYVSGHQWQTLYFKDLKYTDPTTGRKRDLVIDSDILVVLTPNNTTEKFAQYLYATADNSTDKAHRFDNSTNYLMVSAQKDGNTYIIPICEAGAYYLDKTCTSVGFDKSFCIQLGADYYWLHSDENEFAVPTEGGSKEFNFDTYYSTGAWTVSDENGDDLPSWLTYDLADVMDGDNFTGKSSITFTAAALPEGTTSRDCKVNISYYCCSFDINVHQGEGGVSAAVADNGVKVVVAGDDFVVTASSDVNNAEVYNVAGQKVAEAAVAGNATIDASALANGVYIVKFNNGKAVKVVK